MVLELHLHLVESLSGHVFAVAPILAGLVASDYEIGYRNSEK